MPSSRGSFRRILAYTTLFGFIVFMLLYGVAESLSGMSFKGFRPLNPLGQHQQGLNPMIPDFGHYKFLRTIFAEDFPIVDPTRRIIITGDLHGMMKPLENLLHDLTYSPTKDVFIHVGDIITRGPHEDSMALLSYLASNNITGVRGNNDQKVIEWRGWLNWIMSLSGGKHWLDRLEKEWPNVETDESKLIEWMENKRKSASEDDKGWWKLIPNHWVLFGDHYRVARDMSAAEFQYLLDLPLCLHVPSAHVFIVHAGLLPSDPKYPYYDETRQPLARMPTLEGANVNASKSNNTRKEVERLRTLQEISLLKLIPQNLIPWVILNMRGVLNGKVFKKKKGMTPWSDLWNQDMNRCVGYDLELAHDVVDIDGKGTSGSKKHSKQALPCYPSTVIYGHAAARGLDLKRWSIGLDSGCVYGKKLSALVIGGTANRNVEDRRDVDKALGGHAVIESHDSNDYNSMKEGATFLFSDNARAMIRTIKCQR